MEKIGEAGHIIFVTIDGDPFAGKQIRGGYYDGSVVQDALAYGDVLVQMLDGYIFPEKRCLWGNMPWRIPGSIPMKCRRMSGEDTRSYRRII